jgi:hypothetical protein
MKKYTVALLALTIVLILVSFCTLWFGDNIFQPILALTPLYFAIITGLMHYGVVKSFYKDPRTFVKNFLGITVGSLFLHLCVLFIWSLTHLQTAKIFILGFCICYVAYLVFETVALVLIVRNARQDNNKN